MLDFWVVVPKTESIINVKAHTFNDALQVASLKSGHVDFGTLSIDDENNRRLSVVVYEFGLLEPSEHFFVCDKRLYAGNALLFASNDEDGETISVGGEPPSIFYLHSKDAVEKAIQEGRVKRPQSSVNGEVLWEWPGDVYQKQGEKHD